MSKKDLLIIADYHETSYLTLDEICVTCDISADIIHEFIEYDIIHPRGDTRGQWIFSVHELKKIKKALRLKQDLEINLAGIALLLDLLEEREELISRLIFLEEYFLEK